MHNELGRVKEENRRLRELLGRHRIALLAELIPGHTCFTAETPLRLMLPYLGRTAIGPPAYAYFGNRGW